MTPRITKDGNSVTISEPSECERLCEALSISVKRAISLNPSESTNILIGVWRDLEEAHPAAARAIREGIERARKPVGGANMLVGGVVAKVTEFSDGTFECSDKAVSEHLFGPGAERFVFTDRAREQDSTNAPPPEDLSALKKRIGWKRREAEIWKACVARTREVTVDEIRFAYTFELMMSYSFPEMGREQLRERLQVLLDHEDEE